MSDCREIGELLVLDSEGELDPIQSRMVKEHVAVCAECRQAAAEIGIVRGWLADPDLFAPEAGRDWDTLAPRLASEISGKKIRPFRPMQGALRWALPVAACLVMVAGALWMLRRPGPPPAEVASIPAPGNQEFLEKMDRELATSATARYLAQCQDLLVDTLKAGQTCTGKGYNVAREVVRARELLKEKRILNPELDTPEVARELCNDLENVLVNLSLSSDCESRDKFRWMESMIEREKLLLRIRLVQSEIS